MHSDRETSDRWSHRDDSAHSGQNLPLHSAALPRINADTGGTRGRRIR